MNVKLTLKMCVVAIGISLLLQATATKAEIVTTEQMEPQSQVEADKLKMQTFIDRAEIKDKLQTWGVDESMSKVRVASMTNEEIHVMAQKIDAMPAGGRLSDSDLIIILLLVLLILLI